MNTLDLIAAITIGTYLMGVVLKGNSGKLLSLAKRDKAFLKWAIALGVLYYLYGIPELKGAVSLLIVAAMMAFFMQNLDNIKSGTVDLWSKLGA